MARKRGRILLKPVDEGLKAIGLDAGAVEDIIVTHMHYDHTGNHDLFPRARYHLQDDEMAYATGRLMRHTVLRIPFEADDVVAMVRKVFADRVTFHDGAGNRAGHHRAPDAGTPRLAREDAAGTSLASDAASHAHSTKGACSRSRFAGDAPVHDDQEARGFTDHIVPGHDPQVVELYPAAAPASRAGCPADVDPKARGR
jgi:ribonuclease BN (tRNA processing enzyme)